MYDSTIQNKQPRASDSAPSAPTNTNRSNVRVTTQSHHYSLPISTISWRPKKSEDISTPVQPNMTCFTVHTDTSCTQILLSTPNMTYFLHTVWSDQQYCYPSPPRKQSPYLSIAPRPGYQRAKGLPDDIPTPFRGPLCCVRRRLERVRGHPGILQHRDSCRIEWRDETKCGNSSRHAHAHQSSSATGNGGFLVAGEASPLLGRRRRGPDNIAWC